MGWTPHTKEELTKAGVVFGNEFMSPNDVIVFPDSGKKEGPVSNKSTNKLTIGNGFTSGMNAKELTSGLDMIGSLAGPASGLGSDFEKLQKMIQSNTDRNNAWSAEQAAKQNAWQERQNQIAMDFNSAEAARNRNWQQRMSNTAHQREVADLQAAGLNPVLSAGGGNGAAVTSGATASGVTSAGAKGETDTSANSAITGLMSSLISANASMENTKVSAQANMAIAQQQMAMQEKLQELQATIALANQQNALQIAGINSGTNMQIAQINAENQRFLQEQEQEFKETHPQNIVGAASSALNIGADIIGGSETAKGTIGSIIDWVKEKNREIKSGKYKR